MSVTRYTFTYIRTCICVCVTYGEVVLSLSTVTDPTGARIWLEDKMPCIVVRVVVLFRLQYTYVCACVHMYAPVICPCVQMYVCTSKPACKNLPRDQKVVVSVDRWSYAEVLHCS